MMELFICPKCGGEDSSYAPMFKEGQIIKCIHCKEEVKVNLIEVEEGKDLSLKDYVELMQYINEHHSMRKWKGKRIKYITATIDFRTGGYHHIKFSGCFSDGNGTKEFYKINQNRHKDMKKWIYEWLESE